MWAPRRSRWVSPAPGSWQAPPSVTTRGSWSPPSTEGIADANYFRQVGSTLVPAIQQMGAGLVGQAEHDRSMREAANAAAVKRAQVLTDEASKRAWEGPFKAVVAGSKLSVAGEPLVNPSQYAGPSTEAGVSPGARELGFQQQHEAAVKQGVASHAFADPSLAAAAAGAVKVERPKEFRPGLSLGDQLELAVARRSVGRAGGGSGMTPEQRAFAEAAKNWRASQANDIRVQQEARAARAKGEATAEAQARLAGQNAQLQASTRYATTRVGPEGRPASSGFLGLGATPAVPPLTSPAEAAARARQEAMAGLPAVPALKDQSAEWRRHAEPAERAFGLKPGALGNMPPAEPMISSSGPSVVPPSEPQLAAYPRSPEGVAAYNRDYDAWEASRGAGVRR